MLWISCADRKTRAGSNAAIVLSLLLPACACAHSPHDIVTDIAAEPAADGQVFIVITDQLFRSDDRRSPWKNLDNGLDIRHPFVALAMSPRYRADDTVYTATSGDGVFRSTDRGRRWSRINAGLRDPVLSRLLAAAAPDDGHVLLAAAKRGGLWQRHDHADRWNRVLSDAVVVTALASAVTGGGSRVLLAGDADGRLWRSADQGRLWGIVSELPDAGAISSIAANEATVFVGTRLRGLYKSDDHGESFARVASFAPHRTRNCAGALLENPVPDTQVTSVTLSTDYRRDSTVYVTTWYNAVFVSGDGGRTWLAWSDGLSCNRQAGTEGLPHFSRIAINPVTDGAPVFWLAAFDGLFRASGPMSGWHQPETLPLGLIKGMAVHQYAGEAPSVALATYGGGFYLSQDLGRHWIIGNRGLVTTRLTGIAFAQDFAADRELFAGADRRLLWSSDGGESWRAVFLQQYGIGARISFKLASWGAPKSITRTFYDARKHAPVYPTLIITQPPPDADRILFATRFHGVMSYDTATGDIDTVWDGTDRIMNTFLMSPAYARDKTLFASIRGEGIIRSSDSGRNWESINEGLGFVDEWAGTPEATNFRRDVKLAASPDFDLDRTLFAGSAAASGLYASGDGGDRWRMLRLLPDRVSVPVLAIAVSPAFAADDTLVVSVKGHGLFRSTDRGDSFDPIGRDLLQANASVEHLAFSRDYATDETLIAASDEALFVSRDEGETWATIDRPVRYEDMRDVVRFSGDWVRMEGAGLSAMTETRSVAAGARARLDFYGTGVQWIGSTGPGHGRADVLVDGVRLETVDTRSDTVRQRQVLYSTQGLPHGRHTVEVRTRADGTAGVIAVDAFDVLSLGQTRP